MKNKETKIIVALSGGGTGGPVVPLLNVARVLKREHSDINFIFFGTNSGPEFSMVNDEKNLLDISYLAISSGKFRRYFSLHNFFDFFKIILGFFQSLYLLLKYRPKALFAAGAFVAVAPAWAAKILGIPVLMHQQDVRPGLANQLIAPIASLRTVTFENSLNDYKNAVWIGNPIDEKEIAMAQLEREATRTEYGLNHNLPIILVTGGGTGADYLNSLVVENSATLCEKFQIVHLSGSGKKGAELNKNYHPYNFLSHKELLKLMALSDLVISRCGLGTLSELSLLSKPAILIPIPNSHQEDNAKLFESSSVVLSQKEIDFNLFTELVSKLMADEKEINRMSGEINKIMKTGSAEYLAEKIYEYSRKKD